MRDTRYEDGFTLVELLVALMVVSIIFTAVATLACALGAVNDATNDMAEKQAQVRYASLRISELIRHCKLICGTSGSDIAVWRADDNGDGEINPQELVYLDAGTDRNYIKLLDFPSAENWQVTLSSILSGTAKQELILICEGREIALVPECNNVQILLDVAPPRSKSASVHFDLVENGVVHQYQISDAIRGWAGHLLNEAGDAIVISDDD
jgi:prepilin-type N-terminal cleavage/methylation domain-containing protein